MPEPFRYANSLFKNNPKLGLEWPGKKATSEVECMATKGWCPHQYCSLDDLSCEGISSALAIINWLSTVLFSSSLGGWILYRLRK